MTIAEQMNQTEAADRVFVFRDQHGNQTLFDRATGQSCMVTCPLAPRADDNGCQHPSGSCKPEGCSAC